MDTGLLVLVPKAQSGLAEDVIQSLVALRVRYAAFGRFHTFSGMVLAAAVGACQGRDLGMQNNIVSRVAFYMCSGRYSDDRTERNGIVIPKFSCRLYAINMTHLVVWRRPRGGRGEGRLVSTTRQQLGIRLP